jgi:3-methylcrotonyl-CoA carboxylase alpha subunit
MRFDSTFAPAALATQLPQRQWLEFEQDGAGFTVTVDGRRHRVAAHHAPDGALAARIDGRTVAARVEVDRERTVVRRHCLRYDFVEDTGAEHRASAEHEGHFRAPMPGHVLDVRVVVDQAVAQGAVLLVLEAMKMEHSLTAPWPARIVEVKVKAGDRVEEGSDLIRLEPAG